MANSLMSYLFGNHRGYAPVPGGGPGSELDEVAYCSSSPEFSTVPIGDPTGAHQPCKVTLRVVGMVCSACSTSIESTVKKLAGVEDVSVSVLQHQAQVMYRPELVKAEAIREAIEDTGFEATILEDTSFRPSSLVCRMRIRGMTCSACSGSIESALMELPGVTRAVVSLAIEEAEVEYDPSLVDQTQLVALIDDVGFESELLSAGTDRSQVSLRLEGIKSQGDATAVESALLVMPGVKMVEMDYVAADLIALVSYDPDVTGPRFLSEQVKQVGTYPALYEASVMTSRDRTRQNEAKRYELHFLWSTIFTVPIFLISMVFNHIPLLLACLDSRVVNNLSLGTVLRWILATPVQFVIGWRFYVASYKALCRRSANMDVLVALGTNTAYFYSVYTSLRAATSVTFMGADFFQTSAMLISFILLGKYLEVLAKGKTSEAIAKLLNLAPSTALLVTLGENGSVTSEREISSQLVQRHDIMKVVPGAKIPADGVVLHGQSHVNESMISGEAHPVPKQPGDKVTGGTFNENGVLFMKATHVGSETALSQIVRLVEVAQMSKAPVQQFADQVSKYFVPFVVLAATLTWLGWFIAGEVGAYPKYWIPVSMDEFELALQFGISVLVIACPCAMGLATPTAVMVGTGQGAVQGVLIKGGSALESAHKVNCIVFDKTGTLTMGKPKVIATKLFNDMSMRSFYEIVAACETNSEHVLSRAVMEHLKALDGVVGSDFSWLPEASNFENLPGRGVRALVAGKQVVVGNQRLMKEQGILLPPDCTDFLGESERRARTCVVAAFDKEVAGAIAVADPVKPEAAEVIAMLGNMGIWSIMVTGDNQGTANAIAKEVGITDVMAEVQPTGKAEKVKELQAKGFIVAMVGDGINDSPALVAADVGMAIGAGTDIAIEAAEIVLMKSNLEDVITAIDLSRKTFERIKLNYVWALSYNVISIPVAAGLLFPLGIRLPPWVAGAAMAASSVSVVLSSLLLRNYRRPARSALYEIQTKK